MLRVDGGRLWQSVMDMAEIGATDAGGSCRLALSDEDKAGRDLFAGWCREEDCGIHIDSLGNMFARRAGADDSLAPIVIGSHLDTQPHGGRFDGVYGVLAGLEIVRALNRAGAQTRAPLEIVNWTNEEGARFAPAMLASGVYAGVHEAEFALSRADGDGRTLERELERIGYAGDEPCGARPMGCYLEAHIEQGPVLERNREIIGVVTGAQGTRWFDLRVAGADAHAGSTPMPGRKDALAAAAALVSGFEELAGRFLPHGVATCGEMHVLPNSRNTVPGEVRMTLDLRHPEDAQLAEMAEAARALAEKTAAARGVEISCEQIWHGAPVKFARECVDAVESAAAELGYPHRRMVSGAGHDACQVARKAPTAMVFVPCEGGVSHNEQEYAEPEHLEAGANTLLHAALKFDSTLTSQ